MSIWDRLYPTQTVVKRLPSSKQTYELDAFEILRTRWRGAKQNCADATATVTLLYRASHRILENFVFAFAISEMLRHATSRDSSRALDSRRFPPKYFLVNLAVRQGFNVHASLMKNWAVRERYQLQLLFELLNAFDHPIMGGPDTNPTSTTFD